ncbi:MAG: L,D-transpeptidase [Rhizobiales bacterium 17-65-6]|nr:MAG: L,D-transpeptidase [Rhizobiales bacterium 12-68-15]OYX90471.1 MAG: L,D-transpeptidase [Azorhizobium sp. 32-67-21]OYY10505.1 MAG: L,D-transpeptidase [Rhizobiales bacterium 35-68-8]OYZ98835.1 MAG: L,D-transpeptidase [Rhizobiales bacterium 17-65-6]
MASDSQKPAEISRRLLVFGAPLFLAACQTTGTSPTLSPAVSMYGPVGSEPFPVDAVDVSELDPKYLRQEVAFSGKYPPGSIVVDVEQRFLYLVQPGGRAIRYGVGVGKQGYSYRGWATIKRKEKWPSWTPTPNMIRLQPERYGPYARGLPGGEENPLGPRALYLYDGDRDTMFRLHGTIEPWSIGEQVSSGCVRLLNQDIIDLYERVPLGTRVYVM